MSITNELRKVAAKTECANGRCEKLYRGDLDHIADRIDAEAKDNELFRREAEPFCDRLREAAAERADVTLFGVDYVALPLDADGESIRVGERVQLIGNDPSTVSHMNLADDGWRVYVKYDGGLGTGNGEPKYIRHYHKPTVEDVLREFGDWYAHTKGGCDEDGIVAEYAAKLRLAGEDA